MKLSNQSQDLIELIAKTIIESGEPMLSEAMLHSIRESIQEDEETFDTLCDDSILYDFDENSWSYELNRDIDELVESGYLARYPMDESMLMYTSRVKIYYSSGNYNLDSVMPN